MQQPFPTGTITFLFTDIEGSTKLWESHPDAMREAVARHDALLRQAVAENGGYLFKTTGDGIAAAFALAPDALLAALFAQTALFAEPWSADIVLRARMGLHTGAAELRDGDYFGTTLNRCARLMAAGHGGQTLLSDVTHELTRDTLPPDVSLLPLGEHRLKDLARPETIYQAGHPSLSTDFPPLRTLDETPNNLPQQLTSFIGREKPLAEVATLLAKTRLLTLTGSGGSGKTRLSLQTASNTLEQYSDGAWLVELAALAEPSLVLQAVAAALGVREQAGQTLTQTLTDFLRPKRLLLVLDNCEHLVKACATLVAILLRACPQIKVLATSREPLGIGGELTYRVPSLTLPDPKRKNDADGGIAVAVRGGTSVHRAGAVRKARLRGHERQRSRTGAALLAAGRHSHGDRTGSGKNPFSACGTNQRQIRQSLPLADGGGPQRVASTTNAPRADRLELRPSH